MYSDIGYIQPLVQDYSIVTDYAAPVSDTYVDLISPAVQVSPTGLVLDVAPTDIATTDTLVTQETVSPGGTSNVANTSNYIYLHLYFRDKKTGAPLLVNGKLINLQNGEVLSEIKDSSEAEVQVWDVPLQQLGLQFWKTGYKKIVTTADQLQIIPDPKNILFEKGEGTVILYTAAALAALLFVYYKSKRKRVGAFDKKKALDITAVVALGIGVFLAYKLVKKILDFLGVTKSPETAGLDAAATDPNSFWNPNYWQTVKPAGAYYTYTFTYDQAAELAKSLYDAFGMFNDNEEQAINVFKQCHTKANASYICYVFQSIYGEDCLTFLRGGWWPQDRLSDTDVWTITNYVNNLKAY